MIQKMHNLVRGTSKYTVFTMCVVFLAGPITAQAGYGYEHKQSKGSKHTHHSFQKAKGHRKGHGKGKARMTICHYNMEGELVEKSLPIRAALRHLANHDMDKEPVVGDDGVESCVPVQPRETLCKVNVDGVDMTVAEYLAANDAVIERFNTDSDSCDLFTNVGLVSLYNNADGAGLDVFFGNNRALIGSQEQYDDCAFDIETAAQTDELCPDVVQFNVDTSLEDSLNQGPIDVVYNP